MDYLAPEPPIRTESPDTLRLRGLYRELYLVNPKKIWIRRDLIKYPEQWDAATQTQVFDWADQNHYMRTDRGSVRFYQLAEDKSQ